MYERFEHIRCWKRWYLIKVQNFASKDNFSSLTLWSLLFQVMCFSLPFLLEVYSVVCVTHKSSPNNNKLNSALLGHLLNSKIIFIVSECYDKGGLRARGDLTQHWTEEWRLTILCYTKLTQVLFLQTDCCSTLRWLQKVCQPKNCNFIHALKLFTICLAKDVTANFYDCLRKVWFLYFPFSIP